MLKRSAAIALFLAASAASAVASPGSHTYSLPYIGGLYVDATTWQYPGGDTSPYTKIAADNFCRHMGYDYSQGYDTVQDNNHQGGTWRFNNDGSSSKCDFCQWYFLWVKCTRN